MRAYILITGAIFGLVTLTHIWRMTVESHLAGDPWYLLATVVTAALSVWAWRLLAGMRKSRTL